MFIILIIGCIYLINNDFYFIMMSVICFVVSTYGVVFSVTFDI
jgi:hypothetical protein